jgi:hypothetical protein
VPQLADKHPHLPPLGLSLGRMATSPIRAVALALRTPPLPLWRRQTGFPLALGRAAWRDGSGPNNALTRGQPFPHKRCSQACREDQTRVGCHPRARARVLRNGSTFGVGLGFRNQPLLRRTRASASCQQRTRNHSGSPAFRNASDHRAKSSARRNGGNPWRLEIRSAGSSSSMRATSFLA